MEGKKMKKLFSIVLAGMIAAAVLPLFAEEKSGELPVDIGLTVQQNNAGGNSEEAKSRAPGQVKKNRDRKEVKEFIKKHPYAAEKYGEKLEKRGERLQERGQKMEQRGEAMQDKAEVLDEKGNDKAAASLEEKGEALENRGEALQKRGERQERLG